MTISEDEIRKDFERFIRHEAMRANVKQDTIINIIKEGNYEGFLGNHGEGHHG